MCRNTRRLLGRMLLVLGGRGGGFATPRSGRSCEPSGTGYAARLGSPGLLMAWLLAGLALAPTGCNHAAAPNPAQPAAGGPVAVTVVHPEKRPIRRVVEQPGRVQAFEETELHVKLPGFVGAIAADPDKKDHPPHDRLIDIGGRVKAGQVLAELAVPELKAEAEQKEAAVRQTQAEVEQARRAQASAEAGISAADEAVKEATAGVARAAAEVERWDAEFTQTEKLVSDRVIDVQSREVVRKQRDSARAAKAESEARVGSASAAVRKAKAERDKAAADVTAATARVDVAKADAKRVAALLDYTHITAPYDGVVTRRRVNTGDFLQPGTGKAEGVFVVARTDPVRVVIDVPE